MRGLALLLFWGVSGGEMGFRIDPEATAPVNTPHCPTHVTAEHAAENHVPTPPCCRVNSIESVNIWDSPQLRHTHSTRTLIFRPECYFYPPPALPRESTDGQVGAATPAPQLPTFPQQASPHTARTPQGDGVMHGTRTDPSSVFF